MVSWKVKMVKALSFQGLFRYHQLQCDFCGFFMTCWLFFSKNVNDFNKFQLKCINHIYKNLLLSMHWNQNVYSIIYYITSIFGSQAIYLTFSRVWCVFSFRNKIMLLYTYRPHTNCKVKTGILFIFSNQTFREMHYF